MPGVPSSRGCEGCRRRKKKCDLVQPCCGRCQRLDISCIGSGQQRYKFHECKNGDSHRKENHESEIIPSFFDLKVDQNSDQDIILGWPSQPLTNKLSILTSAFVHSISTDVDIKFQLPWNFGPFLEDIPCRLGTNECLDAAVDALIIAYHHYCIGGLGSSNREALVAHSYALRTLRHCLDDPIKAHSSETLCAVMLLSIHQVFTGDTNPNGISHSNGAAQILKSRGRTGPQNVFEQKLLLSLRGPVIFEGILSPKINFTKAEWDDLVLVGLEAVTPDVSVVRHLAHIPVMISRGRSVLQNSRSGLGLETVRNEVHAARHDFAPVLNQVRAQYINQDMGSTGLDADDVTQARITQAHLVRMYGLALTAGLVLNIILEALGDSCAEVSLETAYLVDEIICLAPHVEPFRPLGGLHMTICLATAWVAVRAAEAKSRIEAMLEDYRRDISASNDFSWKRELARLKRRFCLGMK